MSAGTTGSVDSEQRLLRAVLFVPGNDRRKLEKAGSSGADLVVIDLEDAVAETEKTRARRITRDAVSRIAAGTAVAVRVNGTETGRLVKDVAAVTVPGLSAIVVPKVETIDSLHDAEQALVRAEDAPGVELGAIGLIALLETPLGIARCEEILLSAPSRTITSMFGVADFSAALGVELTEEGSELSYARGRLIVATRAAGMPGPIDGPYLRVDDIAGLLADSRRSRALGFQGRVALHPRQVDPINQAYSELTDEQLANAQRTVDAFEDSESSGVASIRVEGKFVDYPVYALARAALRRHTAYRRDRQ